MPRRLNGLRKTGGNLCSPMRASSYSDLATKVLELGASQRKLVQPVLLEESCATFSFSDSLEMCLCTKSFITHLSFITPGITLNAAMYADILETHLIESLEILFPDEDDEFIFQHDLTPTCNAKNTQEVL